MYGLAIGLKHSLDVDIEEKDPFKVLQQAVLSRQLFKLKRYPTGSIVIIDLQRYATYSVHIKNNRVKIWGSRQFINSTIDDFYPEIRKHLNIETFEAPVNMIYIYHGFETNGRIRPNSLKLNIHDTIVRTLGELSDINMMGVPTFEMLPRLAYGLRFREATGYVLSSGFVGEPGLINIRSESTNPVIIYPSNDVEKPVFSSRAVRRYLPGVIDDYEINSSIVKRGVRLPLSAYEITNRDALLLATEKQRLSLIGRNNIAKDIIRRFKRKIENVAF